MSARADERELIRRTLAGDREAFRLVVLAHQQRLAELVFRQTGDRAATEDLVQETFLRAYRSLDRFDPRFRLSTWLARIALNVARDHGRRRLVRDERLQELGRLGAGRGEPGPADEASRAEARRTVVEALETLPPAQREAVVLAVYGGLSQREISQLLETPLGTVKTRLRTAFGRLRDLVAPLHPGGAA